MLTKVGMQYESEFASKSDRPRVLHIVDTLGMGGAETWILELMRYWATQPGAPQIDILATSGNRGIFDSEVESLGGRIFYLPFGRAHLVRFFREFRRILRSGGYVAVHDHQDYAAGWHNLLSLGAAPRRRVAHVHSPWIHISANYGVSPLRRLTAKIGRFLVKRLATHVTGTSAEILEVYGFRPSDRSPAVSVVHCGIDVDKFNKPRDADRKSVLKEFGWAPDTRLILFAGRLDRELEFKHPRNHKNSWLALHVAKAALQRDPSVRLLMAGAGDEQRAKIDRHIADWGLQDQLRLIGVRQDVPRLMRAADLLLFPSHQEGLGMVAVEAQAVGLPVLASTAVPRECVVSEALYTALDLDEPVEAWAETVARLVAQGRPDTKQAGDTVRASAFSIENSAAALVAIYTG